MDTLRPRRLTGPTSHDLHRINHLGAVFGCRAAWAAVPVTRLDADFFRLRSGVAGEFAQKFTQYHIGLAVVGDIEAHVAASAALRDLVVECDRGDSFWFIRDVGELRERLSNGVASGRKMSVWE